jgi:hypothetical protein
MNLGIADAELWQSQGSFCFECGILEISLWSNSFANS